VSNTPTSPGMVSRGTAWFRSWHRTSSRAARWAVWTVLALAVYLGVAEPLIDLTNSLNNAADGSDNAINRAVQNAARRASADQSMKLNVQHYGLVELPAEFTTVSADLDRAIEVAFKGHEVSGKRTSKRRPAPLGRDAMSGAIPAGREVQRISAEVSFEASQEVVAKVIADLERSPIITQISDINLRVVPDKKRVQATITPEAWIYVEKGARK